MPATDGTDHAAPRGPGRPAQLSREQIVEAVAAADDVDTLTMRELASRLNVRHGALYRWVHNRDELFDLLGATVVDRILARAASSDGTWRARLERLVRAVRDEFLALPGYATHLSRPHPHDAHSTGRLQQAVVEIFTDAGIEVERAEQSWYVVITGVVGWLAFWEQAGRHADQLAAEPPPFDTFLGVLLRGLPVRE